MQLLIDVNAIMLEQSGQVMYNTHLLLIIYLDIYHLFV